MKKLMMIVLLVACQQAGAACEASIVQGSHTANDKQAAIDGAWEDAREACYPGQAQKLDHDCQTGSDKDVSYKCVQKASCTLCGDDLMRKYEAMD